MTNPEISSENGRQRERFKDKQDSIKTAFPLVAEENINQLTDTSGSSSDVVELL
jgi:hypothetical protein